MKTKLTETKLKSALGLAGQLFSGIACLGAVILICTTASAQNLFVSGSDVRGGVIYKLTWDEQQSVVASGLTAPLDLAFDSAGNLFVVDHDRGGLVGNAVVYRFTPKGTQTIFASRLSYSSYLAADDIAPGAVH